MEIESIDNQDIAVLALFSLSYVLGVISHKLINSFPLTEGEVTLYKIILGGASFLTVAIFIGSVFLFLTRRLVINPIRKDLEEATVSYDGETLKLDSNAASESLELSTDNLQRLGYLNVSEQTDQQSERESDE